MTSEKSILNKFFLHAYQDSSYINRKKAGIFMWLVIILTTLTVVSFILTNLTASHIVTREYIISIAGITIVLLLCLWLLRNNKIKIATILAVCIPMIALTFQGLQMESATSKQIYLTYLLLFLPMTVLIGSRTTEGLQHYWVGYL